MQGHTGRTCHPDRLFGKYAEPFHQRQNIRIARVFNVSTDFLLREGDVPDRLNYDISELDLSVQAARNLYTHKVNPQVVNALLENPEFANTTNLISELFG